jgi:hypothetical protein
MRGTMNFSSDVLLVRREAHHQIAPVVGDALDRPLEHRLAHVVEHDVDAAVPASPRARSARSRRAVVDRHVGAELATQRDLLGAARGRDHARARVHGELDRRRAGAAAAAWISTVSPASAPRDRTAEPRQVEREVERRGVGQRDRIRHRERRDGRTDRVLGVSRRARPSSSRRRARHARLAPGRRVDDPHHLHARGVGQLGAAPSCCRP